MTAPTVAVTVNLSSMDGPAVAGVTVRAKLTATEIYGGFVVSDQPIEAVTNEFGIATLNCFPNAPAPTGLGTQGSQYVFSAAIPGGRAINVRVQVPNAPCALHALVPNPDIPALDAAEAAIAIAQSSASQAAYNALLAQTYAQGVLNLIPDGSPNLLLGWDATGTDLVNITPQEFAVLSNLGIASRVNRSGDGVTTTFDLGANPGTVNNTNVFINAGYQSKNSYSLFGNNIIFSEAPPPGTDNIEVVLVASTASSLDASAVAAAASAAEAADILEDINASTGQAQVFANAANVSANDAADSAADALAAAQASGSVLFYDTKALADAALAGLPANQVVEVFVDESRNERRTRYRKESGVYVFKVYLDTGLSVYVDSNAADDSANGLSLSTPKKTLAAAIALLTEGSTLYRARGSHWFEPCTITPQHVKVRSYGDGNRPIIDGGLLMAGVWTQHGTYTNLWFQDITFAEATSSNFGNAAGAWHPALYDQATSSRVEESGVTRVLNGDSVGGGTVAAAAINDLLTIANAAPGRFTVHKTGSTNVEPRSDNGTQFRFYLHAADGSNPNTNGRSVYVVDQRTVLNVSGGTSVHDAVIQRCGAKDMVGRSDTGQQRAPGEFVRVDFLEAAIHATVIGGIEFRNCIAKAAYHGDSVRDAGGAYHQHRGGISRGFKIYDCEAHGFGLAMYSHGAGGLDTSDEHVTFDVDGLKAYNCATVIGQSFTQRGVRARRVLAVDCGTVAYGMGNTAIIEDSVFLNPLTLMTAYRVRSNLTLRNTLVYRDLAASGLFQVLDPFILGTISSGDYPTLTLENSTIHAKIGYPGNTQRMQQHWTMTDSILHQFQEQEGASWMGGTWTATNSMIGTQAMNLTELRAKHPGIASNCYGSLVQQTFSKTVASGDMAYYPTERNVTYDSATGDNGDGTADLICNFNGAAYNRWVRVVDAYGSGLHYEGRIVNAGVAGGNQTIVVTPVPTASFETKTLLQGRFGKQIWSPATHEAAVIDADGVTLKVTGDFTVGQIFFAGAMNAREGDYGVRRVTAKNGNLITIDPPCAWMAASDNPQFYNTADGTTRTGRAALPTLPISYGFPIAARFGGSGDPTGAQLPKLTVTKVEGGSFTAKPIGSTGAFDGGDLTAHQVQYTGFQTKLSTGLENSYGGMNYRGGWSDTAFPVAVGDTLTLEVSITRPDMVPTFATNPELSLDGSLAATHPLAKLGIGYQRRTFS